MTATGSTGVLRGLFHATVFRSMTAPSQTQPVIPREIQDFNVRSVNVRALMAEPPRVLRSTACWDLAMVEWAVPSTRQRRDPS